MRFLIDAWRWILHCFNVPKDHDHDERQQGRLAEAICELTSVLCARLEQRKIEFEFFKAGLATKQDLEKMEKRIMASQAEITQILKDAVVSLKQTNVDIKDLQTKMDALTAKVAELQALVDAGGTITQELVDVANEVKTLAAATDEAIPNAVVVPPPV